MGIRRFFIGWDQPIVELANEFLLEELVEELTADSVITDTIAALVSTGFKKKDAEKAVKRVAYTKNFSSVEDLLITTLDRSNT